jgi:CelD/BcsL family acetyltransferase involved in cellulose biosynthesis
VTRTSTIPDAGVQATDAPDRCQFDVLVGRAGLRILRDDWKRITRALGRARFCQLYEWYESYLETLGADATVYFFVARRSGLPVGVVPLVHTTRKMGGLKLRSLELVHHPHMLLADAVFARAEPNRELLGELLAHLRRASIKWDVLFLPNVLEDGCLAQSLAAGPRRLTIAATATRCDYLECAPFEELAERFSKNFKGNLRKARNKLARAAGVEYVTARRSAELPSALADFLDVEASGWKGAAGTGSAIKLDREVKDFYAALIDSYGPLDACEINLLKVEGQCVAGQFCLVVGDTSYMLKIGYDESYAQFAPGNMLLEHTLRRYVEEGGVKYVNLVTDAEWHANWKPLSTAVLDVRVFNTTVSGLCALFLLRAKRYLSRFRRRRVRPGTDRNGHGARQAGERVEPSEEVASAALNMDGARRG